VHLEIASSDMAVISAEVVTFMAAHNDHDKSSIAVELSVRQDAQSDG
jgi:hypothetical protein